MAVTGKGHPWDDLFYKAERKGTNANKLVAEYHESASLTYECLNDRNEYLIQSTVPMENYPELCRYTCEYLGQDIVVKAVTYIGPRTVMRVSGGVQDPECAYTRKPLIRVIRHKSELSPGGVEYNAMSLFVTKKYHEEVACTPGEPEVTFDTYFMFSGCVPAGCYSTRGWAVQPTAIANVVGWEFDEATQAYSHVGPKKSDGGYMEVLAENHVFKTLGGSGGEAIMFNAMPVDCGPVGFDGCGWSLWARSGYFLMSCGGCYQQSFEGSYGDVAVVEEAMPWVSLMTGITDRTLVSTAEDGVVVGRVPVAVDNVIEYWMGTTEGYDGGNFGDDYCYDSLSGGAPVGIYRCGTEVVAVSTRFRFDLVHDSISNVGLGFREDHGSKGVEAGDWLPEGGDSCTTGSLAHITDSSVQLGTKVYPAPVTGGGEPVLGAVVEADGLQYDGGGLSTLGEVKFSLNNDVWERLSWGERDKVLEEDPRYMTVTIRATRVPDLSGSDSGATDVGVIVYNSAYDGLEKSARLEYDETRGIASVNIDKKDIFCAGKTYPEGVCMEVLHGCTWRGLLSKGEFENAGALFGKTCFEGPGHQGCFIPSCYYK